MMTYDFSASGDPRDPLGVRDPWRIQGVRRTAHGRGSPRDIHILAEVQVLHHLREANHKGTQGMPGRPPGATATRA